MWRPLTIVMFIILTACGPEGDDITNATFSSQNLQCTSYVDSYMASVKDLSTDKSDTSQVSISDNGDTCTLSSNSIPNHDFNDNGDFMNQLIH